MFKVGQCNGLMADIDGSHGKNSNHPTNNTRGSFCEMPAFSVHVDRTQMFSTYCGQLEKGHGEAFRSFVNGPKNVFFMSQTKLLFNEITF